jgi:hypothetical protein
MARPFKTGLDYWSHDVDMSNDDKVQLLELEHGLEGYAVMNKLYERIYSNGYYAVFGEREQKLFARNTGTDAVKVQAILGTCLELGIFDKGMHERYGILTSSGIQKRYFVASKRRECITVEQEYAFDSAVEVGLDAGANIVIANNNPVPVGDKPVKGDGGTQRKVPERKQKLKKETELPSPPLELVSIPGFLEAWEDWKQHRKEIKKPLTPTATKEQLAALGKSSDPVAMIRHSIASGYQGLFEPKFGQAQRPIGRSESDGLPRFAGTDMDGKPYQPNIKRESDHSPLTS